MTQRMDAARKSGRIIDRFGNTQTATFVGIDVWTRIPKERWKAIEQQMLDGHPAYDSARFPVAFAVPDFDFKDRFFLRVVECPYCGSDEHLHSGTGPRVAHCDQDVMKANTTLTMEEHHLYPEYVVSTPFGTQVVAGDEIVGG